MKRLALALLHATAAVGLHAETYIDNARVRSVDPPYESVTVCVSVHPVGEVVR